VGFRYTASVGVVQHDHVAAQHVTEQLCCIRLDPLTRYVDRGERDTVVHRARQCNPDRSRASPRRDYLGDAVRHSFRDRRRRSRFVARWMGSAIDKIDNGRLDAGSPDVDADAPLPHCRSQ
jgi:hypothetical protein